MALRLKPWMLVSAAWFAPAALAFASSLAQHRLWNDSSPALAQLLFDSLDWLVYGLFVPPIFWVSERWPLSGPSRRRGAWLVHVGTALLFCVAWATVGTALKRLLGLATFEDGVLVALLSWLYITIPFGVGVYFGMVAIEHAIRHISEARQLRVRVAEAEAQAAEARLASLEARLNPHFLFNALNSIAVLVAGGANERATTALEELSDLLRATLERGATEITLERELAMVRRYLAVEALRFPDRLRPTIEAPPSLLTAAVPALALQHLVENAIRHGLSSTIAAGRIEIRAERDGGNLVLTVRDDGTGIVAGAAERPGHGLALTRERLRAIHGTAATLHVSRSPGGGTMARLVVPYRELVDAGGDAE